jgi:hypothetical protein
MGCAGGLVVSAERHGWPAAGQSCLVVASLLGRISVHAENLGGKIWVEGIIIGGSVRTSSAGCCQHVHA